MSAPQHIVLGVSGSIAAYKSASLASLLVKEGMDVRAIMTPGATRFLTPLTLEAITGHPVAVDVWDEQPVSSRMGHIALARWADLLVVAPASASALARLAHGLADDLLGATALSCRAPLLLAPAMESAMFGHPATQANLVTLVARGADVIGPETGRLASGAEGIGRMSEPDLILARVQSLLMHSADLRGCRVLVTAGPTHEPIDRVRFIGNRSSGKMGYAIVEEAKRRGAVVTLVTGPTALSSPPEVETVRVESAAEMRDAVLSRLPQLDAVIMAAAVADFRPAQHVDGKVRRSEGMHLELLPTTDIAAEAVSLRPEAVHVGFALEAEDLIDAARRKLERKGQDLVVGNAISPEHNPFGSDHNQVVFVTPREVTEFPSLSKTEVAARICDELVKLLRLKRA